MSPDTHDDKGERNKVKGKGIKLMACVCLTHMMEKGRGIKFMACVCLTHTMAKGRGVKLMISFTFCLSYTKMCVWGGVGGGGFYKWILAFCLSDAHGAKGRGLRLFTRDDGSLPS